MNRLRALAGRPIGEGERRGAFWAAGAILVCAAAVLLLLPGEEALPPPSEPIAGAGSRPGPAAALAQPVPLARPLAAARRFLGGFLPFLYGGGSARAVRAAAPSLRVRLVESRLRVPPAARDRHPRPTRLDGRHLAAGRVLVTARIEDGGIAAYPIALTLARRGGRWLVVAEGMD